MTWIAAGLGVLVAVLVAAVVAWRRRRHQGLERRMRDSARAMLAHFVIPDGNGGEIEVEYALLTAHGILLADIKEVDGHVFGSEGMQDWTVLSRKRRFTFPNPQPGLWDRVAAVRRIVPEVPVEGYIVFTSRARFSKGQPRGVVSETELLKEIGRPPAPGATQGAEVFLPGWDQLREAAITARIDHLIQSPR